MSTNFAGVTFAKQKVTPSHDAIVRRAILTDGTLTGCEMSYSGSTLTMTAGQLMICGRQIVHPSTQNWAVTEQTSGFARLVITIDLTRTSTKDTFDQVLDAIQYATSKDGFAELEQTDINTSGTKYQVAACVVSLGPGGITGIVSQLEKSEGGGAGLNFKVVGGDTQPASPTENTIWVPTDIDIPYWTTAASSKTPAYVAEKGVVTFWWESATDTEVSGTTDAGFTPVKYKATNPPGNMRLKPINCYQNQDGTAAGWEPMDAYIYKGGEWVQFHAVQLYTGYIYRNGAFVDVTGLTCTRCHTGTAKNNLTITSDGNVYANAYTAEMVDMTDASTVKIVLESGTKGYSASIGVMPTTPIQDASTGKISGYQARKVIKSNGFDNFNGAYTLDVSDVTGEQYVVIEIAGSGSGSGHLIVSEISYL